jgi:nitroreductase
MIKPATTSIKILDEIKNRWSPRAFSNRQIEPEKLERIFEAARWSASCNNEQPWRFLIGIKDHDEAWQKIFDCLTAGNQVWCKSVPVLVLFISKKTFTRNDRQNKWSNYDLGQAAAYISIQAMAEGIYVHQMAGFDQDTARRAFSIPEDFEIKTAMAIGYYGDINIMPENIQKSEKDSRSRKDLSTMVFSGRWNEPAEFI